MGVGHTISVITNSVNDEMENELNSVRAKGNGFNIKESASFYFNIEKAKDI